MICKKNLFYTDLETFKIMVTGSLYPKQGLAYIDLNMFRFFGTNRWRRNERTLNKFSILSVAPVVPHS